MTTRSKPGLTFTGPLLWITHPPPPSFVSVWACLDKHADADGRCWPSHKTIRKESQRDEKTVREAIRHFTNTKCMTRPKGSRASERYPFILHPELAEPGDTAWKLQKRKERQGQTTKPGDTAWKPKNPQQQQPKPAQPGDITLGRHHPSKPGDIARPATLFKELDPINSPCSPPEGNGAFEGSDPAPRGKKPGPPTAAILALYNSIAQEAVKDGRGKMPTIQSIKDDRLKATTARWKSYPSLEVWEQVFRDFASVPYSRAYGYDTITRLKKFRNAVEGTYKARSERDKEKGGNGSSQQTWAETARLEALMEKGRKKVYAHVNHPNYSRAAFKATMDKWIKVNECEPIRSRLDDYAKEQLRIRDELHSGQVL